MIFSVVTFNLCLDIDHDGTVSFKEFVMVTHILFDGTEDEKLDCKSRFLNIYNFFRSYFASLMSTHLHVDLFKLYDTNSDGYLTPEEVGQLMSSSLRSMKLVVKSFGDPTLAGWSAPVSEEEQAKQMTAKFLAGISESI